MNRENNEKIDKLASHVSMIKQITTGIGSQMASERGLLSQLDGSFLATKKQVG